MAPAQGEKKRARRAGAAPPTRTPPGGDAGDEAEEATEEGLPAGDVGGFLPELLRRGLTLGFTGFFMTEEALRRALGDSVPRDWVDFFVQQSDRTRTEFLDRVSREFGRVLSALDPVEVARRLLDGQTLEVSAKIRLSNGGRASSVRVGREEKNGRDAQEGDA